MKKQLFFILVFSLYTFVSIYSQQVHPKWKNYLQKHNDIQEYYKNKLEKEGYRADSVCSTDSIIISYISIKANKLIKKQNIYFQDNCNKSESENFYNQREQLIYTTYCTHYCPGKKVPLTILHYERYEYDRKGRLKTHIIELPTPMTIRIVYGNKKGKQYIKECAEISRSDFWE